jgi:hypothetical protein
MQSGNKRITLPMLITLVTMGEKEKAEKIIQSEIESFSEEKRDKEEFCNRLGINLLKT